PYGNRSVALQLDEEAVASLAAGRETLVMAGPRDEATRPFLTKLVVQVPTVRLDEDAVDQVLAEGRIVDGEVERPLAIAEEVTRALLDGRPVVAWTSERSPRLVRLEPPGEGRRATAAEVVVRDLAGFLSQPLVPGSDGRPVSVALSRSQVSALRLDGTATVNLGGDQITLIDGNREDQALRDGHRLAARALTERVSLAAGVTPVRRIENRVTAALPSPRARSTDESRAVVPLGLPVAVFMPWRQVWQLTGFSRGELRGSLALAPQEETTVEVSSWERRLRTLDQSSQTEVDQSFESVQTQRDTDDVFAELTRRHDFAWQLEGSVDATYSTGNGSITVAAGGKVSDTSQLQSVARVTQQRMKESTLKSAARIRAIRTTRITDAVETGGQSRVTRLIKNTNYSRTLTLDFFETLAHYKVTLVPRPERLVLVALLPNPLATKQFNRELVRRHESALYRALLDPAVADGFAACRTTRAYELAKLVIADQATMGKQVDIAADDLNQGPTTPATKTSPQEQAVIDLLKIIRAAFASVSEGAATGCDPALKRIPPGEDITPGERTAAQQWLFQQLCSKYFPAVWSALARVPATATAADAELLVAVVPAQGSATTLSGLNDKSDRDKEQCGLGEKIGDLVGRFNWNWSSGRTREENLYTADDGGLAGLLERLKVAYQAYLGKQVEGELAAEKEVVIAKANAQQDKLSTADKLAMAFPLDELAAAGEREEALLAHLNEHPDHYSFALFQGMSPAEQSRCIEVASQGALKVGMFEPRVIAVNGAELAVPLAPQPAGGLRDFVEELRAGFEAAFTGTADTPDELVFPTPGLTINTRLGQCSTSEEYVETSRRTELRRLAAEARAAELEADRRAARIQAGDYGDPDDDAASLRVCLDRQGDG
ncbi:hypothetical protein, partial [Streptomyces anandii]|uniref:hypothetical protein n=1 Tax=Streptomyces anandii TaxID=285454 RepID=UPI001674AAAD